MEKNIIDLVFLGAAASFHEISEIIRCVNQQEKKYNIIAILDDNEELHGKKIKGVEVVGGLNLINTFPSCKFIFGIGSMKTRLIRHEIIERLNIDEERFETIIHPSANIDPSAKIGNGCIIHPGVCIGNDAIIESFAIITVNSAIGPYTFIDKYSMITSLVVLLTGVKIGKSVFIGSGSCISENISIGAGSMIAMGSVIGRNIKHGSFVVGNPGKVISQVDIPSELI